MCACRLTSISVVALVSIQPSCETKRTADSEGAHLALCRADTSTRACGRQVPIDVYSSLAQKADSKVYIAELWSFSYWSTQVLTWLLIPLLQGYVDSGAFTVAAR